MPATPVPENRASGLGSPYSVSRLPTLTEVLELGHTAPEPAWSGMTEPPVLLSEVIQEQLPAPVMADEAPPVPVTPVVSPVLPAVVSAAPAPDLIDTDEIVARVLAQLEPRIATMLEARMNEALAPALARVADGLIRDSREQLGLVLHELVRETLAQVLRDATRFERHAP